MGKIGYGTWGLGGVDYGPVSEKKALKLLKYGIQKKINFLDTAPLYGNGSAEKIIGKLLESHSREKIIISTKSGMLPHRGFDWQQDFSINNILQDLSKSLLRLKTGYIDYYLLHNPNLKEINIKKIISFSQTLKKLNLIKKFGISLRSPKDYFYIRGIKGIDVLEFNFNLLDQRACKLNLLNILKRKKIISICRTPLCFGFLTDNFIKKKKLSNLDHRKYYPSSQFRRWIEAKGMYNKILLNEKYKRYSDFALNFCLSHDFDYVIPGMLSIEEIKNNVNILKRKKLTQIKLKRIHDLYNKFDKKIFVTNKKQELKKLKKYEY